MVHLQQSLPLTVVVQTFLPLVSPLCAGGGGRLLLCGFARDLPPLRGIPICFGAQTIQGFALLKTKPALLHAFLGQV